MQSRTCSSNTSPARSGDFEKKGKDKNSNTVKEEKKKEADEGTSLPFHVWLFLFFLSCKERIGVAEVKTAQKNVG